MAKHVRILKYLWAPEMAFSITKSTQAKAVASLKSNPLR